MSTQTASYLEYLHLAGHANSHAYLEPVVRRCIAAHPRPARLCDLGCGNGSLTNDLADLSDSITGVELSHSGLSQAQARYPNITFVQADVSGPDLAGDIGTGFDVVTCMEVVEHLTNPRALAKNAYTALAAGGVLVMTTPYHSYIKNLALAISGKLDSHFTALWDGGHIKFWSWPTLRALLAEAGFQDIALHGAGRIPWLWKSMVVTARKPAP